MFFPQPEIKFSLVILKLFAAVSLWLLYWANSIAYTFNKVFKRLILLLLMFFTNPVGGM